MSVTFRADIPVPHFDYASSVCGACKGRHRFAPDTFGPEADRDCDACYGDGGDWQGQQAHDDATAKLDGSFNVANGNAAWIESVVLGVVNGDLFGRMSPSDVLVRLSSFSPVEAASGVRSRSVTRGVVLSDQGVSDGATMIDCGRSGDQIDRYLHNLKRCAELALAAGVEVVWA